MSMHELLDYLNVLRKRWWLGAVICGVTLGVIIIVAQLAPPQYEATVRFLVNVAPSSAVVLYPDFDRTSQSEQIAASRATFIEVLKSPTVVGRAIERLQSPLSVRDVLNSIVVEQPVDSRFVWLTATAADPQTAAELANTLVAVGREYLGQLQAEPATQAREFISAQAQAAREAADAAQQTVLAFKAKNQVGDIDAEIATERTVLWNLVLKQSEAAATGQTAQVRAYEALITKHQSELDRLAALSAQLDLLKAEQTRSERYYSFLSDKENEAKLKESETLNAGFVQVVEPASAPTEPVSPYNIRVTAVSLGASLAVSILLIFLLNYTETQMSGAQAGQKFTPPPAGLKSQASD